MQVLRCHTCGTDQDTGWDGMDVVEGRRVLQCRSCGAHHLWRLASRLASTRAGATALAST